MFTQLRPQINLHAPGGSAQAVKSEVEEAARPVRPYPGLASQPQTGPHTTEASVPPPGLLPLVRPGPFKDGGPVYFGEFTLGVYLGK